MAGQGCLDLFAAIRRALGRLQGRNASKLDGKAKPGVIGSALPETNPLLLGPCRANGRDKERHQQHRYEGEGQLFEPLHCGDLNPIILRID